MVFKIDQYLMDHFSSKTDFEEFTTMKMEQDQLKDKSLEKTTALIQMLFCQIASKKVQLDSLLKKKALREIIRMRHLHN